MKRFPHICMLTALGLISVWIGLEMTARAEEIRPVMRDPFWPVGYEPPTPEQEQEADMAVPELDWPDLPVRGRSRATDGSYLALIEGVGIVRTGQIVSLPAQGHWFHWRITHIDATRVQAQELGITRDPSPTPLLTVSQDEGEKNE